MRFRLKYLVILLAILSCSMRVNAQGQMENTREKIYLQLDKPFYNQNEVIRFNLIVVDGKTHLPTAMSDVGYVELIDPKGSIIKQLTLPIFDGTSKGDFELPDTGGLYTIKAYTSWSNNFDDIYLLERQIPVQNVITTRLLIKPDFERENYGPGDLVLWELEIRDLKDELAASARIDYQVRIAGKEFSRDSLYADQGGKAVISFSLPDDLEVADVFISAIVKHEGIEESIARSVPVVLNNIDLKFYPEGGHPVIGHKSVIAFEGINEFGKGADIRGIVLDEANNIVTRFESFHQGMGSFEMNYERGINYRARIIAPALDLEFNLPEASESPVLVLKEHTGEEIRLGAIGSIGNYQLEGFSKGVHVFNQSVDSKDVIAISTSSLPVGIVQFVLSNSDGEPLSERMVFANKHRQMNIEISTDADNYLPGDQVKMKIKTTNPQGEPTPMKFGLAVVDDQLISFADDKSDHILSYFHLSSELGALEDPTFYFAEKEEKADAALNLLMLVRGWSNYAWKNLAIDRITFAPEKIRMLSGVLVDKNGEPTVGEVYALEVGGNKRMIKITTTKEGVFVVKNFDPTLELYLFTKKPNRLVIEDERARPANSTRANTRWYPNEFEIGQFEIEDIDSELDFDEVEVFSGEMDLSMGGASELQEVVVTAQGLSDRRELTGSVTSVRTDGIENFSSINSLQGKAAGVVITTKSTDPTLPTEITFSKSKSLVSGNRSPLVVVNGFALSPSLSRHFINTEILSPDVIRSITYMDSPETHMQYGGKASNGIVFYETKSEVSFDSYSYYNKEGKYNGIVMTSRKFSLVRDVYQLPERSVTESDSRKELDHLVYWNPEIVTNEEGMAGFSFYTNDQISTFRITAEGISNNGQIGRNEKTFSTSRPLSMDIKLPNQMGYEDLIIGNLSLKNESAKDLKGTLTIDGNGLEIRYDPNFTIPSNSRINIPIEITSTGIAGMHNLGFQIKSGRYSDKLERKLEIFPIGFPTTLSHSASNPNAKFKFEISNVESNSLYTSLVVYPDVISDLESTAASLFREPHGCFEQVSSTTYPSILALRYLKSTGTGSASVEKTALGYIESGYKKLAAYEIKGGGFEWFGHSPAHEGLSAFGLMEFKQMKEVFGGVDDDMIDRTIDWLMSRKNGKGGFEQNAGKYGFSAASKEVNNAYLTYALSEVGVSDIQLEYESSLTEARETGDDYRLALLCNAAYSLDDLSTYNQLVSAFKEKIRIGGFGEINADHSLVRSYGKNLNVEVVSLWALAYLKEEEADFSFVAEMIEFLLESRSGSHFGSTQATTLALQAITEYNVRLANKNLPGEVEIWVNGSKHEEMSYSGSITKPLVAVDFSRHLNESGENFLELRYPHEEANLPYAVTIGWLNKTPVTIEDSPLTLTSTLSSKEVKLNETVRMTAQITNKKNEGIPMTIARLGIPGGLSLQSWQLKELQESRVFDYYEIINEDLVLYFKELGPKQVIEITLDLKAEVRGDFLGRASNSYLYYNDDQKYWVPGLLVKIE